tara:strand:- start:1385 stop:1498 length:114 start_codon:yes stop_codon:yes gene_type:complete
MAYSSIFQASWFSSGSLAKTAFLATGAGTYAELYACA